ncbi:glycogen synthase [Methanocaldococcus infernus]
MRIVILAPTITPIVSYGGLGDVMRDLPKFLKECCEVEVLTLNHYGKYFKLIHENIGEIEIKYKNVKFSFDVLKCKHPEANFDITVFSNEKINNLNVWDPTKYEIFSELVVEYLKDKDVDVVSGHDWMCGLALAKCKDLLNLPTTLTIHNEAFKGELVEYKGEVLTFLDLGIKYSSAINTVSPSHAEEIRGKMNIDNKIFLGILNGIDIEVYDPIKIIDRMLILSENKLNPLDYSYISPYTAEDAHDIKPKIKYAWIYKGGIFDYINDWNKYFQNLEVYGSLEGDIKKPLIGFVGRATYQKGFNTIFETLPEFLEEHDVNFIFLTKGERGIEERLKELCRELDNVMAIIGYCLPLTSIIYASSDWTMMPSYWEPCGLVQMESMAYCTPVVATETGGLKDTIIPLSPNPLEEPNFDRATGVLFKVPDKLGLRWGLEHALNWSFYRIDEVCKYLNYRTCPRDPYHKNSPLSMMMRNCYHHVLKNLSWQNSGSIRKYIGLFGGAIYKYYVEGI